MTEMRPTFLYTKPTGRIHCRIYTLLMSSETDVGNTLLFHFRQVRQRGIPFLPRWLFPFFLGPWGFPVAATCGPVELCCENECDELWYLSNSGSGEKIRKSSNEIGEFDGVGAGRITLLQWASSVVSWVWSAKTKGCERSNPGSRSGKSNQLPCSVGSEW